MNQATINPSPKTRFQEIKGAIEAHHALLQAESFQRAEDMALLHYQRILALQIDPKLPGDEQQVRAMVNGWKLQGVQEYLSEFRNLGEKVLTAQPPGLMRVLDHEAN